MGLFLQILPWLQIGLSVLLTVLILLQRSEAGLGSAFGDSGNAMQYTRRGFEKVLFNMTIIVGMVFALLSLSILILK